LELQYNNDHKILSAWAKHFRNHYCRDDEIDNLRKGTGLSRCDFLQRIIFPDGKTRPGPSVRAGDFGEILVADFVQYVLNYVVPRTRYEDKDNRNESKKGIDVLGFRMLGDKASPKDELITFEVKCALSARSTSTLQNALNDSSKDFNARKGESLNAMKRKLIRALSKSPVNASLIAIVERFQDQADRPYKEISGAAAIHSEDTYNDDVILTANASSHPNAHNLFLILIRGDELMKLVHALYRIAANEA
jgi:hypothetical protein